MLDEEGNVTDSYSYDAYGMLLTNDGETDNSYMYVGEEYNANTGLYYLRARYMNPSTGNFTTMDSYQGSLSDPISLHKYAYANANPVTYTDPTGYLSLAETTIGQSIQAQLNNIAQLNCLQRVMMWVNAVCTSYDVYIATMEVIYGDGKLIDVVYSLFKGMTMGMLISCMLTLPVAIIAKPILLVQGIKEQSELLLEAIEKGDPIEIGVRVLQCITLVCGFGAQCFTGDTLVETSKGLVAIEDLEVGDYVLAEDTVTGEQEYKEVLDVHVSQTIKLVHLTTTDNYSETTINTTNNHPFYVEGKGWVPAIELETGDVLRTSDGTVEVVKDVYVEYLDEPVLIYNLEIEGYHTYYVSDESVLVHNGCGDTDNIDNKYGNYNFNDGIDVDLRGKGDYKDAIDLAFQKTGVSKDKFKVTKWATDKNGKSFPVEWKADNGAEVNIDIGHSYSSMAPTVPHIGYQTGGKRGQGGAVRGHIFVDEVPYNR